MAHRPLCRSVNADETDSADIADKNNQKFIGVHRLDQPHPRHTFDVVAGSE
jgi:hypothetical protein